MVQAVPQEIMVPQEQVLSQVLQVQMVQAVPQE
jgi:hypothetical protein